MTTDDDQNRSKWRRVHSPGWKTGLSPEQRDIANRQLDTLSEQDDPRTYKCGDFVVEPLTRDWWGWFKIKPVCAFGVRNFRIIVAFIFGGKRLTPTDDLPEGASGDMVVHKGEGRPSVYDNCPRRRR